MLLPALKALAEQVAMLLPALKALAGDEVVDVSIQGLTVQVTPEYWMAHFETMAGVDVEVTRFKYQGDDYEARSVVVGDEQVTIKAYIPVEAEPDIEEQWDAARKESQDILDGMFRAGD